MVKSIIPKKGYHVFKYYLLLLSFLIIAGCSADDTGQAPTETFDYATVVEVQDAKTYEGVDGNFLLHNNLGLGYWHAEIDIIFSQTPTDLEIVDPFTKHFMRDHKESVDFASGMTDFTKYRWQDRGNRWNAIIDWEQRGQVVTIIWTFHGIDLFSSSMGNSPISYEQAKEKYPDIDWDNFIAYTIGFTLDWNTGRKRFEEVPIIPSQQILDRFKVSDE